MKLTKYKNGVTSVPLLASQLEQFNSSGQLLNIVV